MAIIGHTRKLKTTDFSKTKLNVEVFQQCLTKLKKSCSIGVRAFTGKCVKVRVGRYQTGSKCVPFEICDSFACVNSA